MHFYDEEISINGPDSKNLNHVKTNRIPSTSSSRDINVAPSSRTATIRQRNILRGSSTDDDGLLQDIIDHDDEDDDDDDDDDDEDDDESEIQQAKLPNDAGHSTANQRPLTRPGSTRSTANLLSSAKQPLTRSGGLIVPSESESDDANSPQPQLGTLDGSDNAQQISAPKVQLSIKPEQWEKLGVHQELKDLFPYILKYTPQSIDTPFRLQPFIPDFVPSVGDVDAFLKVTIPSPLKPQRQKEIYEFLQQMGLYLLDEPSGEQSEPSLLNMKLRSVLTGSGVKARSASASLVPIAKSPKEIDKWINEVEKLHMTQPVNDIQLRKEIEPLLVNWPRSYAKLTDSIQEAYQNCLKDNDIARYVRMLCQHFEIDGANETQMDYIMNVHTLFALYLAANQAWE